MPTIKKRNPTDATLRNVRAENRKYAELERRVRVLELAFLQHIRHGQKMRRFS